MPYDPSPYKQAGTSARSVHSKKRKEKKVIEFKHGDTLQGAIKAKIK